MEITLEHLYAGGAYWQVKYDNGKEQSVMGIKEMKKIIKNTREPIKLKDSLGYKEHSELIKLLLANNQNELPQP